jgi:hypothetical protein
MNRSEIAAEIREPYWSILQVWAALKHWVHSGPPGGLQSPALAFWVLAMHCKQAAERFPSTSSLQMGLIMSASCGQY